MSETFDLSNLNIPNIVGIGVVLGILVWLVLFVFPALFFSNGDSDNIVIPISESNGVNGNNIDNNSLESLSNSDSNKDNTNNNPLESLSENEINYDKNLVNQDYNGNESVFIFKVRVVKDQEFSFWVDDAFELSVKWSEDGEWEPIEKGSSLVTNKYSVMGEHLVFLRGNASRIAFGENKSTPFLLRDILTPISDSISGLTSAQKMFKGIKVTNFSSTNFFDEASKEITNMSEMFAFSNFNQDISNWDTSKVIDMGKMFFRSNFNQPIGDWNTSNVKNMGYLFNESKFNQDISNWNVGNVISCPKVFEDSVLIEEYKLNFIKCKLE